jgi:hypothetical protein
MLSTFKHLWLGEHGLSDAFWRFTVLYGLIVNVTFTMLALLFYFYLNAPVLAGISYVLPWFYSAVTAVGVWRSADRYEGPRIHALAAKMALVPLMGILILV